VCVRVVSVCVVLCQSKKTVWWSSATATQGSYQEFFSFLLNVHRGVPGYRLLLGLHNIILILFIADYFLLVISSQWLL
jgi:hypothetical protein